MPVYASATEAHAMLLAELAKRRTNNELTMASEDKFFKIPQAAVTYDDGAIVCSTAGECRGGKYGVCASNEDYLKWTKQLYDSSPKIRYLLWMPSPDMSATDVIDGRTTTIGIKPGVVTRMLRWIETSEQYWKADAEEGVPTVRKPLPARRTMHDTSDSESDSEEEEDDEIIGDIESDGVSVNEDDGDVEYFNLRAREYQYVHFLDGSLTFEDATDDLDISQITLMPMMLFYNSVSGGASVTANFVGRKLGDPPKIYLLWGPRIHPDDISVALVQHDSESEMEESEEEQSTGNDELVKSAQKCEVAREECVKTLVTNFVQTTQANLHAVSEKLVGKLLGRAPEVVYAQDFGLALTSCLVKNNTSKIDEVTGLQQECLNRVAPAIASLVITPMKMWPKTVPVASALESAKRLQERIKTEPSMRHTANLLIRKVMDCIAQPIAIKASRPVAGIRLAATAEIVHDLMDVLSPVIAFLIATSSQRNKHPMSKLVGMLCKTFGIDETKIEDPDDEDEDYQVAADEEKEIAEEEQEEEEEDDDAASLINDASDVEHDLDDEEPDAVDTDDEDHAEETNPSKRKRRRVMDDEDDE